MGILVLMDFSRLMINRFRKPRLIEEEKSPETPRAEDEIVEAEEPAESEEIAAEIKDVAAAEMPIETVPGEISTAIDERPAESGDNDGIEPDEKSTKIGRASCRERV